MERVLRLARSLGARPGAQLVLGALVIMLAIPATPAGTLARLVVFGALGVAITWSWPSLPDGFRTPSPRTSLGLALAVVALAGLVVFWPVLSTSPSPEWQTGDWGPQHAVLAKLMPHMPGLSFPTWNHLVSTGDAPLDLYPALTYIVTGHIAWLFGLENDLPHAFMIVATLVHLGLALTTTALSARVAPKPVAVVLGLFTLVDTGAISHGGTVGLFQWAILHSAFAHVFSMIAALGILSAMSRPRLGASVTIWIATAISTASHPAALITAATYALALVAVALLAGDVTPRRALVALGHLVLGIALGAVVWLPASERLLEYGQHFPNELFSALRIFQIVMAYAMPITAYSLFVYLGYLSLLIGPWTRRADVIFVTIVGLALMLGLCDSTYISLGLAPGRAVARLGAIRMMMLARPFLAAGAAYVIATLIASARRNWATAPRRQVWTLAALLGVFGGTFLRVAPEWWSAESDRAVSESAHYAPDREGAAQLEAWASQQVAHMTPQMWGRTIFMTDTHEHMHLTAKTGMPSFHIAPIPDLMLRERIEDDSPESLRRFNVRWVVASPGSPPFGDPSSELVFGRYHVREYKEWDGQFARIEGGTGTVETTVIDDDRVEIDVKAPGPVLVVLGMGYYPRWRAHHASGANEPVYAFPTVKDGKLHVVAAWVAPGRTIFTCDGPLPSDGRGRFISLLAALLAAAGVIVWSRARWRHRALRRLARVTLFIGCNARRALELGVPAIVACLAVYGFVIQQGPAGAILIGSSAIRPVATVEARFVNESEWHDCGFSPVTGAYRCEGMVSVSDTSVNLLNDAPPSWAFITPAITAMPEVAGVEVRITRTLRLGGRYWLGINRGSAKMTAGPDFTHEFGARTTLDIPKGKYTVQLTTLLQDTSPASISIVQESTLVPARTFLQMPPGAPPAAISAIR